MRVNHELLNIAEWFNRTRGEVLHEEWRKIIWQSMGLIQRPPPPEAQRPSISTLAGAPSIG